MLNLQELKKVGEITYSRNSRKGLQKKPVAHHEATNTKWVGKEFSEHAFASERLAYDLSKILDLPDVNFPEVRYGFLEDSKYIWIKYVELESTLKKNHNFKELTPEQMQVAIIYRLMGNVDGNMQNILMDTSGKVWNIDYELSGHYLDYEKNVFSKNPWNTWKTFVFLMGDRERNLDEFKPGIERVNEVLSEGKLTEDKLLDLGVAEGLDFQITQFYSKNIISTAKNIKNNIAQMVTNWNVALQRKDEFRYPENKDIQSTTFPVYIAKGHRCAHACTQIVFDFFGRNVPTLSQLDTFLGKNNKEQLTYLATVAEFLQDEGFEIEYYLNPDKSKEFLTNPEQLINKSLNKQDAENILAHSDISRVQRDLTILLSKNHNTNQPTLTQLKDLLNKDYVIICTIDNSEIYPPGSYKGHHVILDYIGEFNTYYVDVGPNNPSKLKKVKNEVFDKAFHKVQLFDYNCLIVKK